MKPSLLTVLVSLIFSSFSFANTSMPANFTGIFEPSPEVAILPAASTEKVLLKILPEESLLKLTAFGEFDDIPLMCKHNNLIKVDGDSILIKLDEEIAPLCYLMESADYTESHISLELLSLPRYQIYLDGVFVASFDTETLELSNIIWF